MGIAQAGDIGTAIRFDCGEDITDQTLLEINYIKSNGDTGTWPATVYNNNIAEYITTNITDLIAGDMQIQVYIETPLWTGHSERASFTIEGNL